MTDDEIITAVQSGACEVAIARQLNSTRTTARRRICLALRRRREYIASIPSADELEWAVTHYGLRGAADHYDISSSELLQWMRRRRCGSTI